MQLQKQRSPTQQASNQSKCTQLKRFRVLNRKGKTCMKKAIFASAAAISLLTAQTAIAITNESDSLEDTTPTTGENQQEALIALKEETNALLAVSKEQLAAYEQALEQAWKASFKNDLRLTAKHITFSGRLQLNEQYLLHTSRAVGAAYQNAYSINLLTPSAVTAYELDQALAGTGMAGLGDAFVTAELKTGVNALFLTSLAIHESAWGKSRIAQSKNNLFGYGAYDRSPYESAVTFGSKKEGIIFVAGKLRQNYLDNTGRYYSGATLGGVNHRYSTDSKWSSKIGTTMNQIEQEIMQKQDTTYEVQR